MEFSNLPLHDSAIQSVEYLWERKSVRIIGIKSTIKKIRFEISFASVTDLNVNQLEPWGPSVSVNGLARSANGSYVIEMQSGDNIQILASSFDYKEVHT